MKYLLILVALTSMVYFLSCTDQVDLDTTQDWETVSAGWEDTVSYRAGDDKARELKAFTERYAKETGQKEKKHGVDKVTICHIPPGNPDAAHTITIGEPALEAHLAHGDTLGPCPVEEDGWEADWETETGETKYQCYASEIVAYEPGQRNDGSDIEANRADPTKALGLAQDNDTMNFVALGFGGSLIVKFDGRVINEDGMDIRIVETSYGSPTCEKYPEKAYIYASQDGVTWTEIAYGCIDMEADLGELEWAKYIKVVDDTNPDDFGATVDGYDVDGIEANCVDEPDDGGEELEDPEVPGNDCDNYQALPIEITVNYKNPVGTYQGYPNFYMGSTLSYEVVIENKSNETLHHINASAWFEYYDSGYGRTGRNQNINYTKGQALAGDAFQEWQNVVIPPNGTITLTDAYHLDYNNVATFFQTRIAIQRFSGRCIDGAEVFNNPEAGVLYDPVQ